MCRCLFISGGCAARLVRIRSSVFVCVIFAFFHSALGAIAYHYCETIFTEIHSRVCTVSVCVRVCSTVDRPPPERFAMVSRRPSRRSILAQFTDPRPSE